MADVIDFPAGGFRFVKGVFPYSAGVAALPGFAVERVRFRAHRPLAEGFAAIAAHLKARGRALTALAACELRSPAQMSDEAFAAFNRGLDRDLSKTAWAGGCSSWYKNAAGRIVNNWSSSTFRYWRLTRRARTGDFVWG